MRLDLFTSDWHHLIKPVLPHTSRDKESPHLQRVRLELGPHALYAVATDRYTIAAERYVVKPAEQYGDWPPVEIEAVEIKATLGLLKFDKDYDPPMQVTVDRAPIPLERGGSVMSQAVTIFRPDDGLRLVLRDRHTPDRGIGGSWRKALHGALTRGAGRPLDGLVLPASQLARWKEATRGGEQLQVWTGPEKGDPILITVEKHFAGVWAARQQLDDPDRERSALPWTSELKPAEGTIAEGTIDLRSASGLRIRADTGTGEVIAGGEDDLAGDEDEAAQGA
jgi:hypothetical protein